MKAEPVLSYRQQLTASLFKEVRVWRLSQPLAGSQHPFKYRLALVSGDQCVLRYDNERGKGDHKHLGDQEFALTFTSMPQLLIDFDRDINAGERFMNRLMIEVASEEEARAQAIASLECGTPQPPRYLFRTQEDLLDTLNSHRFAILKALAGAGPIGVQELARRVGRDLSEVHEDAWQLSAIGLIDKTDCGELQFPYDAIDIHLGWQAAA